MSTTFDPAELLRLNAEAKKKKGGTATGFDPQALLDMNAAAKSAPISFPPGTSTISAETRPYYTAKPLEAFGLDLTAADIGDALPAVGATAAGFIPTKAGIVGRMMSPVLQGVGGAIGEAGRQAIAGMGGVPQQDPTKVLVEGGKQAAAGGVGEVLGAGAGGAAKMVRDAAKRPVGRAVERGAAELNLPPPPEGQTKWLVENTLLGRQQAKKGARAGLDRASEEVGAAADTLGIPIPPAELQGLSAKEVVKLSKETRKGAAAAAADDAAAQAAALQFDKTTLKLRATQEADDAVRHAVNEVLTDMGPQEAGRIVKNAIPGGQQIARREAERLYKEVFEAGEGVTVDIGDWKARMASMMKGTEPFEDAKLKRLRAFVFGTPGEGGMVEGGLPDEVPFKTAHELSSMLRETLPSFRLLYGRSKAPAAALRKELKGTISDAIADQNPAIAAPYARANSFYAQYADVYDRSVVPKVVKANPEDFVEPGVLPAKGISEAQALRRAIIGDAERYGTPEQKAAAKDAALAWQGTFVRQRLLGDGIENLPERLRDFHPEVVDTVMTATPEGKTLLANLRTVSTAIEEAGPRIEAQIASEQERLRKVVAKPGNTPEKAAAMERLKLIEDVVSRSEAGQAKASPWWSIAMGMGGVGFIAGKVANLASIITGAEAMGGILAKAMYDPAWAKQFAEKIDLTGKSLELGAPALARLVDVYMKREKRKEEQATTWKYLTPPPSLIEPPRGEVIDPFGGNPLIPFPPPPRPQ